MQIWTSVAIILSIFITDVSANASIDASAASSTSRRTDLNVMTLNLHGYHPMEMEERVFETREGKKSRANSFLTYFRYEEIRDGHEKQLRYLAAKLSQMPEADKPDILLLQEVGAGLPNSPKDCSEFYAKSQNDFFGKNSALRLQTHLAWVGEAYQAELACRSNIGWQTDAGTFSKERVLTKSGQVVFDFGTNPYPHGFIVEGTALLVRAPYRILEQRVDWLRIEGTNENSFIQFARVQKQGETGWILVANLHGSHKTRHFEFAVAARNRFEAFIASHPDRANLKGVIVGGDFNAHLYRPSKKQSEVSTAPWEVSVPGEFDFANAKSADFTSLEAELWAQNINPKFKPWASIGSDATARSRIANAVARFRRIATSPRQVDLRETFDQLAPNDCLRLPALNSSCSRKDRIDLIYASSSLKPLGGAIAFPQNDFFKLEGPTDHPGIYVRYDIQD